MGVLDTDGPRFYQHTGKGGATGGVVMVLMALVATLVLAPLYVYGSIYIPFIYLNLLLCAGLGGAVGFAAGLGATWSKVRSPGFVTVAGGLMGLNAAYAAWVYWVFVQSGHELWVFGLTDMIAVWEIVYEDGTWSMGGGDNVTGMALAAVWVIEAGMLVVLGAMGARMGMSDAPFCEPCNAWAPNTESHSMLQPPESLGQSGLEQAIRRGQWDVLHAVAPGRRTARNFLEVERWTCAGCDDFDVMTLQAVTLTKDKNDADKRKEQRFIDRIYLDDAGAEAVANLGSAPEVDEDEEEAGDESVDEGGEEAAGEEGGE
jgi:hypothetical protein